MGCPLQVGADPILVCGNTFYHAGSILLLQSGLVNPDPSSEMATAVSILFNQATATACVNIK